MEVLERAQNLGAEKLFVGFKWDKQSRIAHCNNVGQVGKIKGAELEKVVGVKKEDLPQEYHDLWDICCIILAKVKDHKEVIRMQAIKNPVALELSQEIGKTVSSGRIVKKALSRKSEYEQLQEYINMRDVKIEARSKAEGIAEGEARGKAEGKEEMLVSAIQNDAPLAMLEAMRQSAGITEARLAELRVLAQKADLS